MFRYPPQPSLDYIKRVVGLPGDEVAYLNKRLTINGKPVPTSAQPDFLDKKACGTSNNLKKPWVTFPPAAEQHRRPRICPGRDQFCRGGKTVATVSRVVCKVPEGHYFMMGDNRDNSSILVTGALCPKKHRGQGFFVWMNFGDFQTHWAIQLNG